MRTRRKTMRVRQGAEHLNVIASRMLGRIPYCSAIYRYKTTASHRYSMPGFSSAFPSRDSLIAFHGGAYPQEWSEVARQLPFEGPTSAAGELIWSLQLSMLEAARLREFIVLREGVEGDLLAGDRDGVLNGLAKVEKRFGKSIWLAKNLMAVYQHFSMNDLRKDFFSKALGQTSDNPIAKLLIQLYSKSSDAGSSFGQVSKDIDQMAADSDSFANYLRAKIVRANFPLPGDLAPLLFFDANSSAIDLYESLVISLRTAAIDSDLPNELRLRLMLGTEGLYEIVEDARLLPVLVALRSNSPWGVSGQNSNIDVREFIVETMRESFSQSGMNSSFQGEGDFCFYEHLDKIESGISTEHNYEAGSVLHGLQDHLIAVSERSRDSYASALSIFALTDRFSGSSWAVYLDAFVRNRLKSISPVFPSFEDRRQYISNPKITALTYITAGMPQSLPREALNESVHKTIKYFLLTGDSLDGYVKGSALDEVKGLLRNNQYKEAVVKIDQVLDSASRGERREFLAIKSSILLQLERPLKAAAAIIDGVVVERSAPTIFPVKMAVEQLEMNDIWGQSIDVPLLYEIYLSYFDKDKLSNLSFAFEKNQETLGWIKPSDAVTDIPMVGFDRVTAYLDRVWRPEVMRQTMLYDKSADIDQARIEVCETLIELYPDSANEYRDELKARVRRQEIAKGTSLVEQSKVYVDMAAIKRSLKAKLGGAYSRYKAEMASSPESSDDFKRLYDVASHLADDHGHSVTKILSMLHLISETEVNSVGSQFDSMYAQVMAEFLNGEHGLNAYLSTRVRHGKLTNSLRKPLIDEQLITPRAEGGSGYSPNSSWNDLFSLISNAQSEQIKSALEAFSEQFDEIIDFVNSSVIKVTLVGEETASESNPAAFNYWSSNLERAYLQDVDRGINSFDEFVDRCMDVLWEKTDYNLVRLQTYLVEEVRPRIVGCFERLGEEIIKIPNHTVQRALQDAVARARTKVLQKFVEVIGWFKRASFYDRKDYVFDFPFQVAINIINKTVPNSMAVAGSAIKVEIPDMLMPGRTLDGMVDMFDVILTNAVVHSGRISDSGVDVVVDNSGERITIICNSLIDPVVNNEDSRRRVDQLKGDLQRSDSKRKAQMEGGSGLFKVWRTLNSTSYKRPLLDFGFSGPNTFKTSISFEMDRGEYENIAN